MSKCLINEFLESIFLEKGLSQNTISSYKSDLIKAKSIINKNNLSDINNSDLKKIITFWSINYSLKSQNRMISSLKQFIFWAKEEQYINSKNIFEIKQIMDNSHYQILRNANSKILYSNLILKIAKLLNIKED